MLELKLSWYTLLALVLIATPSNGFSVLTESTIEFAENVGSNEDEILNSAEDLLPQESVDWSNFVKTLNVTKNEKDTVSETPKDLGAHFYQFQKISFLTDCSFIVGPDGQEEKIEAHSLVLAVASPLLKEAFRNYNASSRVFRINQISKRDFQDILQFIYLGDICNIKSDSALALYKHADLLGLDGMKDIARLQVIGLMTMDNMWDVYNVAKEFADRPLEEAVDHVLSQKTSDILKLPGFNDISKDVLLHLVSQDYLKIDSEYQLYEAVVRWAMHQAQKQKLEVTPVILRQIIGADVLKQVRFSTMPAAEFAQVYQGFKILSYEEFLAIIFNINAPGSFALPDTVSSITKMRNPKTIVIHGDTFLTYPFNDLYSCNATNTYDSNSVLSAVTPKIDVSNAFKAYFSLRFVTFKKSQEVMEKCDDTREHFDLVISNADNVVIQRTSYDGIPGCDGDSFNVNVNKIDIYNHFKIHVEFRAKREYKKNTVEAVHCPEVGYYYYDYSYPDYLYKCEVNSNGFISTLHYSR